MILPQQKNHDKEQTVATDNIKLNGVAFPFQPHHKAFKQLGVRLAMKDDFSEKAYGTEEMKQRLSALRLDRVLWRSNLVLSPCFDTQDTVDG